MENPAAVVSIEKIKLVFVKLDKFIINVGKKGEANFTPKYLQGRLNVLNGIWNTIIDIHSQILVAASAAQKKELAYFKDNMFTAYEGKYEKIEEKLSDKLDFLNDTLAPPNVSAAHDTSLIGPVNIVTPKLPEIDLPKFSGDIKAWPAFWDLFNSLVHENVTLSDSKKLQYLSRCLQGDAERAISSLRLIEINYTVALKVLKDRYQNKRLQVSTLLNEISSLPSCQLDDLKGLKNLRSTITVVVESLKRIDVPVDNWDPVLIHFLTQKFDTKMRRDWEVSLCGETEYPKMKKLVDFLENKIIILEAIALTVKPAKKLVSNHLGFEPEPTRNFKVCPHCKKEHKIYACQTFKELSVKQRVERVQALKLCSNCLAGGHFVAACTSKFSCRTCGKRHNTMLHFERNSPRKPSESETRTPRELASSPSPQLSSNHTHTASGPVLLGTARIKILTSSGQLVVRALIDSGSQASVISEFLAQVMKMPRRKTNASIVVVGELHTNVKFNCPFKIAPLQNKSALAVSAYVLPKVTSYMPVPLDLDDHPIISKLPLADPNFKSRDKIDIIIGADLYGLILEEGLKKLGGSFVAQKTIFGWILLGDVSQSTIAVNQLSVTTQDSLNDQIKQFWEIEEVPLLPALSSAEQECENHFQRTTSRDESGRFILRLPIKSNHDASMLGESERAARAMLFKMKTRLQTNPKFAQLYFDFLAEYEKLGHMSRLTDEDANKFCVFLPHHGVLREDKLTTKLRVVFNASSLTTSGKSLNDILEIGPKLQADITGLLMNWRLHRFVMNADVEKMFRQIVIHPDDRLLQCILWFDPSLQQVFKYKLNTVTYGTGPAPYQANRVIKELAETNKEKFPLAYPVLLKNVYVDDLFFGASSKPALRAARDQVIHVMDSGKLPLKKWNANDPDLLNDLPVADVHPSSQTDSSVVKLLGLGWNSHDDKFHVSITKIDSTANTKRKVAAEIAKFFDPLGWFSPITVNAKTLLQSLWLLKTDWDDQLPSSVLQQWQSYTADINKAAEKVLNRWVGYDDETKSLELIGFCDASQKAYSAVVYYKVTSNNLQSVTSLLMAKTKVAPIRTVSIPRLELCGAVLLKNLLVHITNQLEVSVTKIRCFTDSKIVLAWLAKPANSWKTFVGNRVSAIQSELSLASWHHVKSKENPADLNSRGMSWAELDQSELWWSGPPWLLDGPSDDVMNFETEEEVRVSILNVVISQPACDTISKLSDWGKLVRVFSYVVRFVYKLRKRITTGEFGTLSSFEVEESKRIIVRRLQQSFKPEIDDIAKHKPVIKQSKLSPFNPFRDEYGLIRVGGRLEHSQMKYTAKHPLLLPSNESVDKIIRHFHAASLHGGVQLTLSLLRSQYWILNARSRVKQIIRQCPVCNRQKAQVMEQQMSALPAERCTPSRPFTHTGVDYAGPILVRTSAGRGHKSHKAWIAVFVCLSTKAVHLEAVSNCTSLAFLAALDRFISRRGLPSIIFSDNGTTFQGANSELKRVVRAALRDPSVTEKYVPEGLTWRFIPPSAPHFGGIWEAGVKSAKSHLKKVLGQSTPSFEELITILCLIEACLNSRPLVPLSDSLDSLEVLTPGHFLIGTSLKASPIACNVDLAGNLRSRWRQLVAVLNAFWSQWSADYLHTLQRRDKWRRPKSSLQVGDLVLLKMPDTAPTYWPMGRISATFPGTDGLVRVVNVKTATNELTRPVTQVCPLLFS